MTVNLFAKITPNILFLTQGILKYFYKNSVAFFIIYIFGIYFLFAFWDLVLFLITIFFKQNAISITIFHEDKYFSSYLSPILIYGFFLCLGIGLLQRKRNAWYMTLIGFFVFLITNFSINLLSLIAFISIIFLLLNKEKYTVKSRGIFDKKFFKKYFLRIRNLIFLYLAGCFLILKKWNKFILQIANDVKIGHILEAEKITAINYFKILFFTAITLYILYIFYKFLERYYEPDNLLPHTKIKNILQKYGKDSLDYFITNHKKNIYENEHGIAGYRNIGNLCIFSGDNICEKEKHTDFIQKLEQKNFDEGREPVWLSASCKQQLLLNKLGYRSIKIGEEAVVNLQEYDLQKMGSKGKNIRRSLRLMEKNNIKFTFFYMRDLPAVLFTQLKDINDSWLKNFGNGRGVERGFSMTLSRLPNYKDMDAGFGIAFETKENGEQKVLAYISIVPVYNQNSFSLDMMRRRENAINSINEFLIHNTIMTLKSHGRKNLSLNFAPLSNSNGEGSKNMEKITQILPENIKEANYIQSLFDFNEQFDPAWKSRYIVFKNYLQLPQIITAISRLEK